MKRLQIREAYTKDFGRKLSHDDFYEDGSINDCFREYLATKYPNADTYIKPFGCFCPDKSEDNINSFVVQFIDRDCIIGKHYNGITLDFIREPNNADNFCYTIGNTWFRHEFVEDGRRFFDGSEKELSYKLVDDVVDFLKNYNMEDK